MRVLVLGSIVEPPTDQDRQGQALPSAMGDGPAGESSPPAPSDKVVVPEPFKMACRSIGHALAKAGHEVIVSSEAEKYADLYVVEGVASVQTENNQRHRVWILRPDDDSPFPFQGRSQWNNVEFLLKRMPVQDFQLGRFYQAEAANAVVAIGGTGGTSSVGQIALAYGKPVLGVPHFQGSGRDLWRAVRGQIGTLDESGSTLNTVLESAWPGAEQDSNAAADTIVLSLGELARSGVFRRDQRVAVLQQSFVLAIELLLLVAWIALFSMIAGSYPPSTSASLAATGAAAPHWTFLLVLVAAAIGVLLRHSLRAVFDPTTTLAILRIVTDTASGLILGFVLCLLFLIGAISMTGSTDSTLTPKTLADFERVAIVMSLFGLTGGFLVEQVADSVRGWLLEKLPQKSS